MDNYFEIVGGVASVYRQFLSLDRNPKQNDDWLQDIFYYYRSLYFFYGEEKYNYIRNSTFYAGDKLETEMSRALVITKKLINELFDKVNSLEKIIEFNSFFNYDIRICHTDDFGNCYPVNYCNEGLLLIKCFDLDAYTIFNNKKSEISLLESKHQIARGVFSEDKYPEFVKESEKYRIESLELYKEVLADKEWIQNAMKELEMRKQENTDLLKQYNI